MSKNTKKQLLNIAFVVLMVLVTTIVLISSNKELNMTNIKEFLSNCNPIYLAIAFLCWGGFVIFEALSLHIILKKLGYKPKIASSIAYSTSDIYYSGITPSATGGQPASAYYMVRDGISGGASGFSLIFNLIGYTAAILIIGGIALIIGFDTFLQLSTIVKVLVAIGIVAQIFLLAFFIACMCYDKWVLKLGEFGINLLHKIKIIKNKEKWMNKLENVVEKYKSSYQDFKNNKKMIIPVLVFNTIQRTSQLLISVFVCMAAIDCSFIEVFVMQAFVMVGYNSLPLPGGVGAYEFLYMQIYCLSFSPSIAIISMMITRIISYYFSIIVSGLYTMIYHVLKVKKKDDAVIEINSN